MIIYLFLCCAKILYIYIYIIQYNPLLYTGTLAQKKIETRKVENKTKQKQIHINQTEVS